ncbi:hypothetical protein [Amycolatopsis alkalitolerans]|uniref:Uncharacterized protein n=1 Tax=Amycolatopsis alkalitolerans TaxID=2547244 RepID=A0A5C4LP40_9PSEU|nr:hypothetical protein [Amycolatopsis alkalitolerans]TNC18870.1 hypothetical protein FG385_33200 [Amycolatopsis alkalitolerans]
MAEPIMASYVQEDDDWAITVAGHGQKLTGRAPGIIAARDNVDQLVESLGAEAKGATVVHLLNGSALEFTAAYMTARLTRPETAPAEKTAPEAAAPSEDTDSSEAEVPAQQSEEQAGAAKPQNKASRRPKARLTADIGDALESSSKQEKVSTGSAKASARR